MNIIIPMAGRGSRLRPHTLTIPKPLIPVGGKPIVHRLVEDIAEVLNMGIDNIVFVIGDFGKETEEELLRVAKQIGAQGHIRYQLDPLGTAHAVQCAEEFLTGPVVVAFADTLFKASFKIDAKDEGILWVKQIEDPSAFGVVKLDDQGKIIDFVEKPKEYVSNLAMIGIYYFKNGERLKTEINYLFDHNVIKGGEYQLPDALRRLTEGGVVFKPGEVHDWMDCGNKNVTVETNKRVLEYEWGKQKKLVSENIQLVNAVVIPPCYIGENVVIEHSVVGPHVSLGDGCEISHSIIQNSIVQHQTKIDNANIAGSMIGSNVEYCGTSKDVSLGDYTQVNE